MKFKNNKSNTVLIILCDGNQIWRENGELHRLDGPAFIYSDGYRVWVQNDKLHRTNGPAVIYPNGEEMWWKDGFLTLS